MTTTHASISRLLGAALLAATALAGREALAQSAGPFEVSLVGGAAFGSRVLTTPSEEVRIGNSGLWGLRVAWAASPSFRIEAAWAGASADLLSRDPSVGGPYVESGTVDTDAFDLDAHYDFGGASLRGTLGLGIGAMTISPVIESLADSETRFTVNATAGARWFFTPHLAVRADGRYRWRDGNTRVGTYECGESCRLFTTNWYSSAELTAGLTWRF